ncbi:MAG: cytochrome c3 family protein [Desulfacinum sp.]|nr:cytochrome c3 family protein [Desulfacinum sp.]MBZ4660181.1 cytochrome [Desulfacinum sp.]
MKRNRMLVLPVLALALIFAGTLIAVASDAPDVITLNSSLWPEHTKGLVEFTHKKHAEEYGIACADCHHKYENGQNVWKEGDPVQKCEECHNEPTIQGEKKLPPDQQKLNLKLAFHNNCIDCHKKLKKENKDSKAPVTCAQCHPKEAK